MTREEAIRELKIQFVGEYDRQREAKDMAIKALEQEPQTFEWCKTCKEYDHDKHCCPRYNGVIRKAVEEIKKPKVGHCKDCKWWKDSDGLYHRGGHAESQCPINRREVFEGNGYCYMFEPQERSNKE